MKKKNTKQMIVEKAFKQFSVIGFDSASIRTISKEVGIRESAIYNHFSSKAAILEEIFCTKVNHNLGAELLSDDILNLIGNPKIFLPKFVDKLLVAWETENEKLLFTLLLKEATSMRNNCYTLLDYLNEFTKLWAFIFEQMITYGAIAKMNSLLLANEFVAPLFFHRIKLISSEVSSDKKRIKKDISNHVNFFVKIISK